MTFLTLEKISTDELLEVFNHSFSDYLVPFHLTKEQLENKIKSENIRMDLSAGVFENNKLAGFVLHGYDVINNIATAYNGGTGVIPDLRGKGLTGKMYEYVIPVLKQKGIKKITLEVIQENKPAIQVYQKTGFAIKRTLTCYKGSTTIQNKRQEFEIHPLKDYNWDLLQSFWDWEPSWQNSVTAVSNLQQTNISTGIFKEDKLSGYIIFNPITKRVQQFAVHKAFRKQGAGRLLFENIAAINNNEITLINIDDTSTETASFLTKQGLTIFVKQYEMEMGL